MLQKHKQWDHQTKIETSFIPVAARSAIKHTAIQKYSKALMDAHASLDTVSQPESYLHSIKQLQPDETQWGKEPRLGTT